MTAFWYTLVPLGKLTVNLSKLSSPKLTTAAVRNTNQTNKIKPVTKFESNPATNNLWNHT
ncbi:hypothetical protein Patl1_07541 [Pistacia atlantica]|uniref:Uncharacterized protein n=1 Tax=Pistacia atlantica TaxID=434234 RepID=A0ACC1AJI4_9ROSI|nr:hypothetical protein Patl1_07541 [Pistacia atlantica]